MAERQIPADDFQIGDLIHLNPQTRVEIRHMRRGDNGELTVNPGEPDELNGYVWQHTTVTRA